MKKSLISLLIVMIGNVLLAIGVSLFVAPTNFIMGGGTGIAFALNRAFNIDISVSVLILNVVLFCLGLIFLGKKFAALTIVSTIFYPVALKIVETIATTHNQGFDMFISSIFGGIFIGLGIGLVLRQGASTGGMDIPPVILNKKLGIPTSQLIYAFDFVIIIAQMYSISLEDFLYSIVILLISTYTIDKTLMMGSTQTQVVIITPDYDKINDWILANLDRGTTLIEITTGYKNHGQKAVMCVLSKRELRILNNGVLAIDPTAFIIISDVHEVRGRGFSLPQDIE